MKRILWLFIFVAFCITSPTKWGFGASSILSNYGQIQNVQNYSSNPFWSPNSPYNKKLPQPVYLQGADLTAADCQQVVQSLISVQCMTRNNCKNTSLSDIRPAIMVQLSSLSDQHNYASSCAGFIDTIFESYMAQYGNNIPKKTAFPTVSVPSPTTNPNAIELHNPYKIETPEWKQDIIERSQELQNLQQQNGAGNYKLSATAFPKTIDDVSFAEQLENLQEGYAPFKDKSAFHQINVKTAEEYCNDSKYANTEHCMEYKCNASSGTQRTSSTCVEWRCSNIANANTAECVEWKKRNTPAATATTANDGNSTTHHTTDPKTEALIDKIIEALPK